MNTETTTQNKTANAVSNQELFEMSEAMAVTAHGNQTYGSVPYLFHLRDVVRVLKRFGASLDDEKTAPLLIAAPLHDAVEDTDLTKEEIERHFGPYVAEIVWRVSDEEGDNRRERKAKTYPKTAALEDAVIMKLADRIANWESSSQNNPGLRKMYAKEHQSFYAALYNPAHGAMAQAMWKELEAQVKI